MNKPCRNCCDAYEFKSYKGHIFEPKNNEICQNCDKYKKYKSYLNNRRKYIKGSQIQSIAELDKHLEEDGFVWFLDKPKHRGWIESMQYRNISNLIKRGMFFIAIPKSKDRTNK